MNLIGEHIDYNDGFVLPMTIPLYTIMVGAKNNKPDRKCTIRSLESFLGDSNTVEFSLNDLKAKEKPFDWANYVIGVVANFEFFKSSTCADFSSFDLVIKSNVPLGSGLSSSAALEVCTYTFLENLMQRFSSKESKALACQRAEHEYAHVPCGIMDQFISTMGVKDHALLIDCKSYESKLYALNDPSLAILVVNSNVKHQLEGSEYSSRRQQCERVAKIMGKSYRDAKMQDLIEKQNELNELEYKRARHAITEIERTLQAVEALTQNNIEKLGQLMNQSHDSLRYSNAF